MSQKKDSLSIPLKEYYELLSLGRKVTRSTSKRQQETVDLKERGASTKPKPGPKKEDDSDEDDKEDLSPRKPSGKTTKKREDKEQSSFQSRFGTKERSEDVPAKRGPGRKPKNKSKKTEDQPSKDDDMDADRKEDEESKSEQAKLKAPKVSKPEKKSDEESKSSPKVKAKPGKRQVETRPKASPEVKRKKTEKGEVSVTSEKRRVRHIEWHYGRHCDPELWLGKQVKVKRPGPAKSKSESSDYEIGKILDIKEDKEGKKNLFQIELTQNKKKVKEWVNISETRVYIFGQILFVKYSTENDQLEAISKTYGWKGKKTKPIPIPVAELLDLFDTSQKLQPYEDPNFKVPIQYFANSKAKKLRQDQLYDYREFKDADFEFIRDNLKNGDKIYSELTNYKKSYSQWCDMYSKINIDLAKSLKEYTCKILRISKGDRSCGKVVVLRVLNEEGRNEIVFIRYLKNAKTEWIDVLDDSEEAKESRITLKLDKIKGVITHSSLRNSIAPKSRIVIPYEFVDQDSKLKEWVESNWKAGMATWKQARSITPEVSLEDICLICNEAIQRQDHLY